MASGTLRAEQVTEVAPGALIEYEVEGPIISYASIADFYVRGQRIDASRAVISNGPLAQGRRVRVRGVEGPGKLVANAVE
jgi:hypothetical protein